MSEIKEEKTEGTDKQKEENNKKEEENKSNAR